MFAEKPDSCILLTTLTTNACFCMVLRKPKFGPYFKVLAPLFTSQQNILVTFVQSLITWAVYCNEWVKILNYPVHSMKAGCVFPPCRIKENTSELQAQT